MNRHLFLPHKVIFRNNCHKVVKIQFALVLMIFIVSCQKETFMIDGGVVSKAEVEHLDPSDILDREVVESSKQSTCLYGLKIRKGTVVYRTISGQKEIDEELVGIRSQVEESINLSSHTFLMNKTPVTHQNIDELFENFNRVKTVKFVTKKRDSGEDELLWIFKMTKNCN